MGKNPGFAEIQRRFKLAPIPFSWFGRPGAGEAAIYSAAPGDGRFVVVWTGANGFTTVIVCDDLLDLTDLIDRRLYRFFDLLLRSADAAMAAEDEEEPKEARPSCSRPKVVAMPRRRHRP